MNNNYEKLSQLELITFLNTPERLARIEKLEVVLVRKTEREYGLDMNDGVAATIEIILSINELFTKAIEQYSTLGDKVGSRAARKTLAGIIERKFKDLLLHCELLFDDEVNPDLVVKDYLKIDEGVLTDVYYEFD
jgi:hypothetical protein